MTDAIVQPARAQPCSGPCLELSELRWQVQQQQDRLSMGEARFDRIEGKLDKLIGVSQRLLWTAIGAVIMGLGTYLGWIELIKAVVL